MLPIPKLFRVVESDVAWRVADDEAVLLHADSSAYFGLNQTGTQLWAQLAERPMSLAQLTRWAQERFPDAPTGLQGEISAFIDQLLEPNLIESTEGAEAGAPLPGGDASGAGSASRWETPEVERFGELEKLILSGE